MTTISSGGTGSGGGQDHHSGWQEIQSGQIVTVSAYKQMVVFGDFNHDGTIYVEGSLILED